MSFVGRLTAGVLYLALAGSGAQAWAADAAGRVKRVEGSVTLVRAGQTLPVQPGTEVQVGDLIRTGADGAVGIALADDTMLSAGAGSEFAVAAFQFNATTHEGSLLARLARGTLHMITGLIGKAAPEKVQVQTPTVVLGVRGTEFIVETVGKGS